MCIFWKINVKICMIVKTMLPYTVDVKNKYFFWNNIEKNRAEITTTVEIRSSVKSETFFAHFVSLTVFFFSGGKLFTFSVHFHPAWRISSNYVGTFSTQIPTHTFTHCYYIERKAVLAFWKVKIASLSIDYYRMFSYYFVF